MLHMFEEKKEGFIRVLEDSDGQVWFLTQDILKIFKANEIKINSFHYQLDSQISTQNMMVIDRDDFDVLYNGNIEKGKILKFITSEGLNEMLVSKNNNSKLKFKNLKKMLFEKIEMQFINNVNDINYKIEFEELIKDGEIQLETINMQTETIKKKYFTVKEIARRVGCKEIKINMFLYEKGLIYRFNDKYMLGEETIKKDLAEILDNQVLLTTKGNIYINKMFKSELYNIF